MAQLLVRDGYVYGDKSLVVVVRKAVVFGEAVSSQLSVHTSGVGDGGEDDMEDDDVDDDEKDGNIDNIDDIDDIDDIEDIDDIDNDTNDLK